MGDGRTYDQARALRAVILTDGTMTDYDPLEHASISRVGNYIIDEVRGINWVTRLTHSRRHSDNRANI